MEALINSILSLNPGAALGFNKKTHKILYANAEATRLLILGNWYDDGDSSKLSQSFIESVEPCFAAPFQVHISKELHLDLVFEGRKLPIPNGYAIYIKDISAMQSEIQSLAEERDRYRSLIQHAPSAVCLFKWNGKTIKPVIVGDEFIKILGVDAEHIMDKDVTSFLKVIHPDEMFMFSSQVRRALFETKSLKGIYRIYNQLNAIYQYVYIEAVCLPQSDGDMFIMCSFTNVHAEREKTRALEQVNEEIKLLYEHIPGAIFKLNYDKNLSVSYANDKFYSYLGYNRDSFYKLRLNRFMSILYEDDIDALQEAIRSRIVNHSASPISLELRLKTADSTLKWVSLSGTVMEDEQSNPYCYFIYLDINEYKTANIAQINETNALISLFSNIARGVIRFDHANKILYANKKALELLGYERLLTESIDKILSAKEQKKISTAADNKKLSLNITRQDGQLLKTAAYTVKAVDENNTNYLVFEAK